MTLATKIQEYVDVSATIAQTNAFQTTNFATIEIAGNDGNKIITKKDWLGDLDISIWITVIRNRATQKKAALKAEIIDILNSGV